VGDEALPGPRRTSREFDEFEQRALRSWAVAWDGFSSSERVSFVLDWRRVCAHVSASDAAKTADLAAKANRRTRAIVRWAMIGTLATVAATAGGYIGLALHGSAPQTIVVRLPSGQQFTVTPPPLESSSP
jgi:hypothetical protein